ncbi:YlxM family DNA-binding protein [Calderihabitans maritimus]|uniref:UPF0122 protein KKC1_19700 n=1 Tax=Calderihabitans maritimus TaxID=1246530 RepID=A0A1Z5HU14_9FIRM|nr:YlxM family DNA-binding protein [Calderihabitans maritimus]GAW92821.1 helix-turn-helix protein YlxM/p13 family protein [Calderihabitans maritimus]
MLPKIARIAWLYDFYGKLLTSKQKEIVELYCHHDLSLGEIAEEYGTSRQAVYDVLKRAGRTLEELESKLGLLNKFLTQRKDIETVLNLLAKYRASGEMCYLTEAEEYLKKLLN